MAGIALLSDDPAHITSTAESWRTSASRSNNALKLENALYVLYRDRNAPGGHVIREIPIQHDDRPVQYPHWQCNQCHEKFPTPRNRDEHEATQRKWAYNHIDGMRTDWYTSGVACGVSPDEYNTLLNQLPEESRPLVEESLTNALKQYRQDGHPPPLSREVPYSGRSTLDPQMHMVSTTY